MKKKFLGSVLALVSVLLAAALFVGCQSSTTETGGKEETLIWYIRNSKPANAESVVEKANDILKQKIGATVEFNYVSGGDYVQKMQMVMASSEVFDICFTSSWANDYISNANRSAYLPLDKMLEEESDFYKSMPEFMWNAVKINNQVFGVPNMQILYDEIGLWLKKDIVDELGIDTSVIKSIHDLTPVLAKVKEKYPNIIPNLRVVPAYPELEILESIDSSLGSIAYNMQTKKVETTANYVMPYWKLMREWYKNGYFSPDVATLVDETPLIKEGKVFSRYTRMKPGMEEEFKSSFGYDVVTVSLGTPIISRGSIISTVNSVSRTSTNPEKAFRLLKAVNTDKELYNILVHGVEGQDYVKAGENLIEKTPSTYSMPAYMIGNQFNSYIFPNQPEKIWQETKAKNESALVQSTIDFSFERKGVESEIAKMGAIYTEYKKILDFGLDDTEKVVAQMEEKLKTAGIDKVMNEMQRQLDEWNANKQ